MKPAEQQQPRSSVFGRSTRNSILKRRSNQIQPDSIQSTEPRQISLGQGGYHQDTADHPDHILPLYKPQTRSSTLNHFNPYQRNRPDSRTSVNRNSSVDLDQVQDGFVAGSSFTRTSEFGSMVKADSGVNHSGGEDFNVKNQAEKGAGGGGLLKKCVGWLFGGNGTSTGASTIKPTPNHQTLPNRLNGKLFRDGETSARPLLPPPLPSSHSISSSTSSNFLAPIRSSNEPRARSLRPSTTLLDVSSVQNSIPKPRDRWLRSQSPFVSSEPFQQISGLPSTGSSSSLGSLAGQSSSLLQPAKSARRHPTTAHATLQIPSSANNFSSLASRRQSTQLFQPTQPIRQPLQIDAKDTRMRSVSPFRNGSLSAGIRGLSGQARPPSIIQSGVVTNFPAILTSSPRRSVFPASDLSNSNLGGLSARFKKTPTSDHGSLLSQKRERDQMSISPERFGGSALGRVSQERNEDRGILGKRRMIWDPEFGFLTEEQRDKMKLEAEHQLREKEGRPLPTNEAEKILEVLETVGGFNSDSSGKRRGSYLPSIPYPTPGRTHGRHPSSTKLSQRLTATNSLAAVYEEQALRSNSSTIIAPISKKLEADRIKRLEEKKGKLRAELRKRKQIAEMHIRESEKLVEKEDEDIACNERLLRRSDRLRSTSVEPSGVTGPPRRSKRKIGKLTSDAVRAKVNSGRSSRSQSVNEDEQAQGTTIKTGRVTRSAKSNLLNSNGRPELSHKVSPPNSLSKSAGRAHKQIDSASPILEDPLDVGNMVASSLPGMRKPDSATASQPLMRASSTFFKSTLSSAVKSTPLSSLRPGRTFSSRRHIKAKVFSAREEHLPPLDDDEDEERVKENEALKKIKLPSTLPSSFRLEKFASPDLTENNLTKRVNDEEKSSVPNHGESSKNPKEEGMLAKNSASSLCPISGTVPSSSLAVASASVATKAPTSTSIFTAKTDASKAVENPVPSLFFQPQKDEQTNSKDNIQHFSSLNGIKRIPSDSTAPDFFKTVSQPDKSSDPKESETPIFFGLKPVASTSLFGATPSSVTENAKELAAHDKASSNLKSDLKQQNPSTTTFSFGAPVAKLHDASSSENSAPQSGTSLAVSDSNFVSPSLSTPTFSFGKSETQVQKSENLLPKSSFGSNVTFGSKIESTIPTSAADSLTAASAPKAVESFSFGAPPIAASTSESLGKASGAANLFGTGSSQNSTGPSQNKSIFGGISSPSNFEPTATSGISFSNTIQSTSKPANTSLFGDPTSSSSFSFGSSRASGDASASKSSSPFSPGATVPAANSTVPFTFNQTSTVSTPSLFSFGSSSNSSIPQTSTSLFGSSVSQGKVESSLTSGFKPGVPTIDENIISGTPMDASSCCGGNQQANNLFGPQNPSASSSAATNFSFGQPTSTSTPATSFAFGASNTNSIGAAAPAQGSSSFFFGKPSGGLVSNGAATTASLFGNGSSGLNNGTGNPIFGSQNTSQAKMDVMSATGSGSFGALTTASNSGPTSLFGNSQQPNNVGNGMNTISFGGPVNNASAPSFTFGLGAPTPNPASIFGASSNNNSNNNQTMINPATSVSSPLTASPAPPATGGFVFNAGGSAVNSASNSINNGSNMFDMGSSTTNNNAGSSTDLSKSITSVKRNIRNLPGRKKR